MMQPKVVGDGFSRSPQFPGTGFAKGYLMSAAESFLKEARKSFRLAADSIRPKEIERYAGMGRDYLKLARDAAKDNEKPAHPPTWWGP
jgi:hypothetical protein